MFCGIFLFQNAFWIFPSHRSWSDSSEGSFFPFWGVLISNWHKTGSTPVSVLEFFPMLVWILSKNSQSPWFAPWGSDQILQTHGTVRHGCSAHQDLDRLCGYVYQSRDRTSATRMFSCLPIGAGAGAGNVMDQLWLHPDGHICWIRLCRSNPVANISIDLDGLIQRHPYQFRIDLEIDTGCGVVQCWMQILVDLVCKKTE